LAFGRFGVPWYLVPLKQSFADRPDKISLLIVNMLLSISSGSYHK
jgi:hypothetical protein